MPIFRTPINDLDSERAEHAHTPPPFQASEALRMETVKKVKVTKGEKAGQAQGRHQVVKGPPNGVSWCAWCAHVEQTLATEWAFR
jgi:hypothetical protein